MPSTIKKPTTWAERLGFRQQPASSLALLDGTDREEEEKASSAAQQAKTVKDAAQQQARALQIQVAEASAGLHNEASKAPEEAKQWRHPSLLKRAWNANRKLVKTHPWVGGVEVVVVLTVLGGGGYGIYLLATEKGKPSTSGLFTGYSSDVSVPTGTTNVPIFSGLIVLNGANASQAVTSWVSLSLDLDSAAAVAAIAGPNNSSYTLMAGSPLSVPTNFSGPDAAVNGTREGFVVQEITPNDVPVNLNAQVYFEQDGQTSNIVDALVRYIQAQASATPTATAASTSSATASFGASSVATASNTAAPASATATQTAQAPGSATSTASADHSKKPKTPSSTHSSSSSATASASAAAGASQESTSSATSSATQSAAASMAPGGCPQFVFSGPVGSTQKASGGLYSLAGFGAQSDSTASAQLVFDASQLQASQCPTGTTGSAPFNNCVAPAVPANQLSFASITAQTGVGIGGADPLYATIVSPGCPDTPIQATPCNCFVVLTKALMPAENTGTNLRGAEATQIAEIA